MALLHALQVSVLLSACRAWSPKLPDTPFLARARQEPAKPQFALRVAAPAPAAVALAPAAPAAAVAEPAKMDCGPTCKDAKKMWKETEETQKMAIELDKKRTAARVKAETDLLVEEVKLRVTTQGANDVKVLAAGIDTYLKGRVQQFSNAVASRHQQVLAGKTFQFAVLKEHQGKLLSALNAEMTAHSYEVAKDEVARESINAGVNFTSNSDVQSALRHVSQAGEEWAQAYHATQGAAEQGFAAWSSSYKALNDPWNNVTGTFEKTNDASKAAKGSAEDASWADQLVRVSVDVTQAAQTQARKDAAHSDLALSMALKVSSAVKGNSGSIVTLSDMLEKTELQAKTASDLEKAAKAK